MTDDLRDARTDAGVGAPATDRRGRGTTGVEGDIDGGAAAGASAGADSEHGPLAGDVRRRALADVDRSALAGALPEPSEQRLPASPLSTDPYSPGALPLPRWVAVVAGGCAILLLPWIAYLAVQLPSHARSAHYDVVWVGFDLAMFAALVGLGWCAWRRSTYTEVMAAITGTMLVTDAWFDVVTANDNVRRMQALASALLIELPLAAVCAWVAQNAERVRRRAYRQLWRLARADGMPTPTGNDL